MKGIYAIINKVNGKKYIGSSNNVHSRFYQHKLALTKNKHHNIHLQYAWNKYGEGQFDFLVLEEINEDLITVEQKYIDSYNFNSLYNVSSNASRPALNSVFFNEDGTQKELCLNIGDKINDFVILDKPYSNNGVYYIKCQCKCGNVGEYRAGNLIIRKHPINCGCDKKHFYNNVFIDKHGDKTDLYPNIGDQINDFIVTGELYRRNDNGEYFIQCKCKCGCIRDYRARDLVLKNQPKNCGCDSKHYSNYSHGKYNTTEYKTWKSMLNRCRETSGKNYKKYKSKGIYVCSEWESNFQNFLDDMGEKPSKKHILCRKDKSGPYNKNNCSWMTLKDQNNNRKDIVYLEYNGMKKTKNEWAEYLSIKPDTIRDRLRRGWSIEKTLSTPLMKNKNH